MVLYYSQKIGILFLNEYMKGIQGISITLPSVSHGWPQQQEGPAPVLTHLQPRAVRCLPQPISILYNKAQATLIIRI